MERTGEEEPRPPPPLLPVQELAARQGAAGDDDVPARYVARANDAEATAAAAAAQVPVVDLGRLCQSAGGESAADEAAGLRSALQSWGLFLVANHGIEASLMDAVMEASREFFRQPLEEKQKHTNMVDGLHFQLEGYGNDRVASEDQVLDWCDRLYLKVEPQDERNLALWPARLRDVLHEFTAKCTTLKDRLLPEMAKLLELDDDYFGNQFGDKADTYARFSYYPPCPRPDLVFGLKPHSDASFISLLMVDSSVGGLQVLRDGVWYDVPTKPHTLLINLGDQMEIMSNGIFKSPVHRVVTNAKKERLSVVLFYSVDPEREIQPVGRLIDENHPALYKKVKVKEYVAGLYDISLKEKWLSRLRRYRYDISMK
ncbi:hypothetical protein SETIT_4G054800v2 [Setaria italica]|uniref:Fe2OG dioxygenase domain-containing protein n=1 Tax=Setaria italica TaxID=4555 RepID=A0A368QR29_SETIT|nr:hypothetical protein SETIT_4G054800v2 [Setaria italica]